jgi:hypothetical protein
VIVDGSHHGPRGWSALAAAILPAIKALVNILILL